MIFTRFFFWTMAIILALSLAAKHINESQEAKAAALMDSNTAPEKEFLALVIDMKTMDCTAPMPSKDSVPHDLSFTQTRTCTVAIQRPEWDKDCFDYQESLVCLDGQVSITLNQTEVGTNRKKNITP